MARPPVSTNGAPAGGHRTARTRRGGQCRSPHARSRSSPTSRFRTERTASSRCRTRSCVSSRATEGARPRRSMRRHRPRLLSLRPSQAKLPRCPSGGLLDTAARASAPRCLPGDAGEHVRPALRTSGAADHQEASARTEFGSAGVESAAAASSSSCTHDSTEKAVPSSCPPWTASSTFPTSSPRTRDNANARGRTYREAATAVQVEVRRGASTSRSKRHKISLHQPKRLRKNQFPREAAQGHPCLEKRLRTSARTCTRRQKSHCSRRGAHARILGVCGESISLHSRYYLGPSVDGGGPGRVVRK